MKQTPISPAESAVDALARFLPPDIGIAPLIAVTRALAGFNRDQLGGTIEVLVALLDAVDGDPDAEADDRGGETVAIVADPDLPPEEGEDDPDLEQTFDEDDWYEHAASGPGCPVSDPGGAGEGEDDEHDGTDEGDISWSEWHTLSAASRRSGRVDGTSAHGWVQAIHEDAEDDDAPEEDDPAGVCDEDGINLPAMIDRHAPDPFGLLQTLPEYGEDQAKGPINEVRAYRIHRAAICEENFKPKSLLEAIYFACERDGISVTTWSRRHFHDPRFVIDLRNGRTPRPKTEAKAWDCVHGREFVL